MLAEFDKISEFDKYHDVNALARMALVKADDGELANELRTPSTNRVECREAAVREALARILLKLP
jgi:hypothetical protein